MTNELKQRVGRLRDNYFKDKNHIYKCFVSAEFDKGFNVALELLWPCVEASKEYSDPNDWCEFISNGNIFGEQDGDPVMAFNKGEDSPSSFARAALTHLETKLKGSGV